MHIPNSTAKNITWAIAAFTLLWVAAKISADGQRLLRSREYGRSHVSLMDTVVMRTAKYGKIEVQMKDSVRATTVLQFDDVSAEGFAESEHPARHDTLLTIGGLPATRKLWKTEVRGLHPVGHTVPITYVHEGETKSATLVLSEMTPGERLALWSVFFLSAVVGLLYLGIGLFTLYKQGANSQARILALLMLALGMVVLKLLPSFFVSLGGNAPPDYEWRRLFIERADVLTSFAMAFWMHLAFAFPFPSTMLRNRPLKAYLICYVPALLSLPGALFEIGGWYTAVSAISGVAKFAQFFAGIVLLRRKRKQATNTLERRQLTAVFLGATLGPLVLLTPILMIVLWAAIQGGNAEIPDAVAIGGVLFLISLAFLPVPVSLLWAFRKYRMMDMELKLRRGTRFAVTTGGLLIVFFGLLYGISTLLLHTFSMHSGTAALAAGLVLALSFAPVQRRTQRLVEQKFFPERRRLRAMLDELMTSASAMPDRAALWSSLQSGLVQGLGMAAVIPVLLDERTRTFCLTDGSVVPVNPDGELVAELGKSVRPLLVDELLVTRRISLGDGEEIWLREHKATVLLPMVIHTRLTGFLVLSFAAQQEDMAAEDLNVLSSVVSQVGLQSENLRLLEENLEKRRLQEQLEMAREVQQRFLPQVLPDTPGLQVAACFRSSLEVAGDYYDIVPLSGGRTLIAVGDVAGKGAGAAMIMANVQAALRSMAHAGVPLSTIVAGVNDLLCSNTSPSQFVTFFAAIYSPADRTFTSINAGHNPPRIIRTDGTVVPLEAGGICLGVLPGAVYEEETVAVHSGDMVVAFTDGVCEAMNCAEEEFGEDRIAELCLAHRECECDAVITAIEDTVIAFRGVSSFEDDFTLLVAKAV